MLKVGNSSNNPASGLLQEKQSERDILDDSIDRAAKERLETLQMKERRLDLPTLAKWIINVRRACTAYHLIDHGLARFLVLDTFFHGTGPLGYIGINLFGANPSLGGNHNGSGAFFAHFAEILSSSKDKELHPFLAQVDSAPALQGRMYIEHSKGFFHLFNQEELSFLKADSLKALVCSRGYAMATGAMQFLRIGLPFGDGVSALTGTLTGALTPILKFRFARKHLLDVMKHYRWEIDPDSAHACRTNCPIPPTHLGITGSLIQGVNLDLFNRMKSDPKKALLGAGLLFAGGVLAHSLYHSLKEKVSIQDDIEQEKDSSLSKGVRVIRIAARVAFESAAICMNLLL